MFAQKESFISTESGLKLIRNIKRNRRKNTTSCILSSIVTRKNVRCVNNATV